MLKSSEIYSDLFTDLDENPISKDLAVKKNENSVKQAIRNLLLTDSGERPFQPNLGGNIRAMLFDNMTPQTIVSVRERIKETIEAYEPRANLIDVIVSPVFEQNFVNVTIVFNVINRQEPVSLEVVINRVR